MAFHSNFAYFLFAEAAAPGGDGGGGGLGNHMFFILIIGFFAVMYFMMILPQKRERNRWNAMVESLKKNDRVLMSCGIIGKVHAVHKEKNEIIVKIDDDSNTKMTFSLAAVARVLEDKATDKAA